MKFFHVYLHVVVLFNGEWQLNALTGGFANDQKLARIFALQLLIRAQQLDAIDRAIDVQVKTRVFSYRYCEAILTQGPLILKDGLRYLMPTA
jgi:hypothetical protein